MTPLTTNGAAAVSTVVQTPSNWSWRHFSADSCTWTFSAKTQSSIRTSLRQRILCINTSPLRSTESKKKKNQVIKTQLCLYLTVPIGKSSRSLFFFFLSTYWVCLCQTLHCSLNPILSPLPSYEYLAWSRWPKNVGKPTRLLPHSQLNAARMRYWLREGAPTSTIQ